MVDAAQSRTITLDGQWSFAYSLTPPAAEYTTISSLVAAGLATYPARVPGNLELDLQAADLIEEPFHGMNVARLRTWEHAHLWYWRHFEADGLPGTMAELVMEGVDCYAEIYLNGQHVGSCDNMLIPWRFCVEGTLRGTNELLIHIRPAVEEARGFCYSPSLSALGSNMESLYVRKAPHMYGWDIMPRAVSAGIWRTVTLQWRPLERLEEVYLETLGLAPDHRQASLALHYRARLGGTPNDCYEIALAGSCGKSSLYVRRPLLFEAGNVRFDVERPALWWPRGRGEQALYACEAVLFKDGRELDRVALSHGIRTVELERTSITDPFGKGEFCFRVNGEKVFVLGTNWVPLDAYHSRDVTRIPQAVALADELGCNMFRCWGGNVYENDLFYRLCDEKGIMVWQDFALACAVYPQDDAFCGRFEREARLVVKRLRQHPALVLWAGDNECDMAYSWGGRKRDPNTNRLTREVLPAVLRDEDPTRPYLPSSPYMDPVAFRAGDGFLPEHHLWGPRDYYKSDFYRNALCHFASEIGYHGCPSPASIRRFISPDKLWPYGDNDEWLLHATSPVPGVDLYDYRVELMAKQVRELFGSVPDNLSDYALASQISQAEAKKFFIELFRAGKWRRTGIIWWNLLDGWPQFSDAIVDYYFRRKLAFAAIRRSQQALCLVLREPQNWQQELVACNDTRSALSVEYTVRDADTGETVAAGSASAQADSVTVLAQIPYSMGARRFYLLAWRSALGEGGSHYLAGNPPFELPVVRRWLEKAGLIDEHWLREGGFA